MRTRYKYPRTWHMPFSPGKSNDDKVVSSLNSFNNKKIVITEKLDGENTTIYNDYIHARSIDFNYYPSRSFAKRFAASIGHLLKDNERIVCENMYAEHSIHYSNLQHYLYMISLWEDETCLDWQKTRARAKELNMPTVPVLFTGLYDYNLLIEIINNIMNRDIEGIVMRSYDSFNYEDFNLNVVKWVRKNHVQTDEHWLNKTVIKNDLGENSRIH